MKRPIRIVAIVLAFAAVLALCACGGSNVNASPKRTVQKAPNSQNPPKRPSMAASIVQL